MEADLGSYIRKLDMVDPEEVEQSRRAILSRGSEVIGYLIASYRSSDSEMVRCRLLSLIAELAIDGTHLPEGFVEEIILRKDEVDKKERATIYKEIGAILEAGASANLFELGLMDPDDRVRANAVEGLAIFIDRFPYENAPLELLERLVDDANSRVRVNVRLILYQLYQQRQRKIIEELKHIARYGDDEEKSGAAFALKKLVKLKVSPSLDDVKALSIFRSIHVR
ncbi:MAG: HEAT repeat domain-containing protein [bacterium]|nr:HEAT repeat domain-containing protein [bacterium]